MIRKIKEKKVLLTFDYELFFGKPSGTFENCLLQPVDQLIKYFKKYQIKTTFFIDVLYYLKMLGTNNKTKEKSKLIKKQLQELVLNGHRIELHLHPHWIDAKYNNGGWIFPSMRHYHLNSLNENKVLDLFISGVQVLEEIAEEVIRDYKVIAFRAGGWLIKPFKKIKKGFKKTGIKIDSSIGYGVKIKSLVHSIDFSNVNNKEFYRFSNDVMIEDENGEFIELPITTYKKSVIEKILLNIIKKSKNFQKLGDGNGLKFYKSKIKELLQYYQFLSLHNRIPFFFERDIFKSRKKYLNIISHPKSISNNSFELIKLLSKLDNKFLNIYDFYNQVKK